MPNNVGLRVYSPTGYGLAQFGTFNDGSVALKVAKPGFEVAVASDDQLIFNSKRNVFKIAQKLVIPGKSINITTPANSADVVEVSNTIGHNLGYTPAVLGYSVSGVNQLYVPRKTFLANGSNNAFSVISRFLYVDDSVVSVFVDILINNIFNASSFTFNVSYGNQTVFLLQETAKL